MATEKRTPRQHKVNPGIYLGRVVSHLDTQFMGGLEVELLKRKGAANTSGTVIQCRYASPFYGQLSYEGMTKNNSFSSTQQSYGFWAVPPDAGTLVIVVMPEGDYSQAFWIGCVPDTGMNFMTPGHASTELNTQGQLLPTGEYNKKIESAQSDFTKIKKPVDNNRKDVLEQNGLKKDWVRGTNTSSARRDMPSMVFGMSTPGPLSDTGPTAKYGRFGIEIDRKYSRLGGSTFVMDDGDPTLLRKQKAKDDKPEYANPVKGDRSGDRKIPANELIRLQTRTGHQILLHNSEDLIYISHGSGDSWIELSANGKIDIYAKDSVSIHSENDLNILAERDINLESGRNINITSKENTSWEIGKNHVIRVGENGVLDVGGKQDTIIRNNYNVEVGNRHDLFVKNKIAIETENFFDVTSVRTRLKPEVAFDVKTDMTNVESKLINYIGTDKINLNSGGSAEQAEKPQEQQENKEWALVPVRIPTKEPWSDHENLNPEEYKKDKTEAIKPDERTGYYKNGTLAEAEELPTIPDTFKR